MLLGEAFNGPYFALSSMYSSQEQHDQKTLAQNSDLPFWNLMLHSGEELKMTEPEKQSHYNAGEIFTSELKNTSAGKHGDEYWGLVSFAGAHLDDVMETRELEVEDADRWLDVPFGGLLVSYLKNK